MTQGIYTDKINMIISKNNNYLNLLSDDINAIKLGTISLTKQYSGSDLHVLFDDITDQLIFIEQIPVVVKNYSDVLYKAKLGYEKQNESLKVSLGRSI